MSHTTTKLPRELAEAIDHATRRINDYSPRLGERAGYDPRLVMEALAQVLSQQIACWLVVNGKSGEAAAFADAFAANLKTSIVDNVRKSLQ